jgi:superfamily II DNA or RNA helicase
MDSSTILKKNGYFIKKNIYKDDITTIKKELTVEPFQSYIIQTKPQSFSVYSENDDYIIVPKYYGLKKYGKPVLNEEILGTSISSIFTGTLREEQKNIIDNIINYLTLNDGGILCLPCASGKTVIALYLACYYKVKTLIIVHKSFLLNQWKERATQFTNANIGIIQQDIIDTTDKDIVIGMLQSISKNKYDNNIFNNFGLVIFDEAHHAPSQYFSKALPIIASKISIGLSATPIRKDKLEKVLFWYFGDIMYKSINTYDNTISVNIINYKIEHEKFREFKLQNGNLNHAKTINKITTIGRRNKFIIEKIIEISNNNERKIIVLSDRIKHLQLLKNRLDTISNVTSDFYIGGMKDSQLKKAETSQILLASYSMASEGLDIPNLNTLFMVTPRKDVEQSIGRILRKIDPNNLPIIYDFVDQIPTFINQGFSRKKLYKKLKLSITIFTVIDNIIIDDINIDKKNYIEIENEDECDFI